MKILNAAGPRERTLDQEVYDHIEITMALISITET